MLCSHFVYTFAVLVMITPLSVVVTSNLKDS
nr:MAG TPA: hypothetical protein [Caudoviricetes sp.]